jgi:hypothetical protein
MIQLFHEMIEGWKSLSRFDLGDTANGGTEEWLGVHIKHFQKKRSQPLDVLGG